VNQPTVVIVSDDAEFSAAISGRWQSERGVPSFTLMSGDLCEGLAADAFDLAIVGGVRRKLASSALRALAQTERPAVLVADETGPLSDEPNEFPRLIVLRRHDGWPDTVVRLASEVLRRCDALERLQLAEQSNAVLERQAALGRYVIEMRHNLSNALTSVLGNAELLLLEGQSLSPQSRSQVDTVRNMALRIHEILQRFSSLEKELAVVARLADQEALEKSHSASAGH